MKFSSAGNRRAKLLSNSPRGRELQFQHKRLRLEPLEERHMLAVLFSDSVNRGPVINNVFNLGALDNASGTTSPHNHTHFYLPNWPTGGVDPGNPIGADIVNGALQKRGLDFGGVQFTTGSSSTPGENLGQDLNMKADFLVPKSVEGYATQAGLYFRSRSAPAGDGMFGGASAGYWVRLHSTGEVSVVAMNTAAGFAAQTARPISFDSTVMHTVEIAFTGNTGAGQGLQVLLDGKLQTFQSALQGGQVTQVTLPATAGSNNGTGGVIFASIPNRGTVGGERADNIVVSTYSALSGTVQSNFTQSLDFGDAPDALDWTAPGNYNTRDIDNGPSHVVVAGLRIGATVDGESIPTANASANADDATGSDDEDGIAGPLSFFAGVAPSVQVNVTNTTGATATLAGWIDYNGNGQFESPSERATVSVPSGTSGPVALSFPAIPGGSAASTYARFRLSTDPNALYAVGAASNGEVEDYPVSISSALVVTTTSDVINAGDGVLSLREAIIQANNVAGADTISVPAGTYTLTITGKNEEATATGDLDITSTITLIGAGQGSTIIQAGASAAAGIDRVFDVRTGGVATFSNMTIRHGNPGTTDPDNGGGIRGFDATLTLQNVSVVNNIGERGAGITADGSAGGNVTITDSVIFNNQADNRGGGIQVSGPRTLFLTRSTVSNNSTTEHAGGIALHVSTAGVIYNSTISSNTSALTGGGILTFGGSNPLAIINSTISNNSAVNSSGGIHADADLTIINTTITANNGDSNSDSTGTGGGITLGVRNQAIHNTIVAGNFKGAVPSDIEVIGDTVNTATSNIIGNATTSAGITHGVNGNIVGNAGTGTIATSTVINTTLANNGGTTLTHALVAGGLAVNAGNNAVLPSDPRDLDGDGTTAETLPLDQRGVGFPRIVNTTVDIGAVEYFAQSAGSIVWHDLNGNGVRDGGEPGIRGAVVELFSSTNGIAGDADDVSQGRAITDASGVFSFTGLLSSTNYFLVVRPPVSDQPQAFSFTTQDAGGDDALDSDVNTSTGRTAIFQPISGQNLSNLGAGLLGAYPTFGYALKAGSSGADWANAVTTDSSGNSYVTGRFEGAVDFDPGPATVTLNSGGNRGSFVAKYSPTGALVWAAHTGSSTSQSSNRIAVDSSGNVYATGHFTGTADFNPGSGTAELTASGLDDAYVLKLDSNGNYVWARQVASTNINGGGSEGDGLAVDSSGNVYVGGYFSLPTDFDPGASVVELDSVGAANDAFLLKLNSSGNFVWVKQLGAGGTDSVHGVTVDASGNVYATGVFEGTTDFDPNGGTSNRTSAGLQDVFVWKLSSSGALVWAASWGGTGNDESTSVAVDASGNVYTAGDFLNSADFDPAAGTTTIASAGSSDIWVSKLNSGGNLVWARTAGGLGEDFADGLTLNGGNVAVSGAFSGTADFNPSPTSDYNLTSAGLLDGFVWQLSGAGDLQNAIRIGGAGDDAARGAAVDATGNLITSGIFAGTADFNPTSGTFNLSSASGSEDAFLFSVNLPALGTTSVTNDNGNLRIEDTGGGNTDDTLTIKSDTTGSIYVISDPGNLLFTDIAGASGSGTNTITVPFGAVPGPQISVLTLDGNDSLTVDYSLGNFTKLLYYDGGTQTTSDSLSLTGGSFSAVAHTLASPSSGSVFLSDSALVVYDGLEPITDNLNAAIRAFAFTGGDESISLVDAAGAKMTIDSTLGESITFTNPTDQLVIHAGTGNDTMTVSSVDSAFNAAVTINGEDGTDTIQLNADLTLAAGRTLQVTAETINIGNNTDLVTSGNGTITITADDLSIASNATASAGASTLTIAPQTAARPISLGNETAGQLSLTNLELSRLTAGTVQIGDAASGTITVNNLLTPANSLSLTTGANLTIDQSITMAAGKNLTVSAASTVTLSGSASDLALTGGGDLSLTTSRNIIMSNGGNITAVDGDITLSANQQTVATSGNFAGINIGNASILLTGNGNLLLAGRGGDDTIGNQVGVLLFFGTQVQGGAVGTVTVNGTGGASTGNANYGVRLASQFTSITSSGANVTVTANGGGTGVSSANHGISIENNASKVTSLGATASVTVYAFGGNLNGNGGGNNIGFVIGNGAQVTSSGGPVRVEGTGGGSGTSGATGSRGVVVGNAGIITSAGTGPGATVTVIGIGRPTAGNPTSNSGIQVSSAGSRITSSGGNVYVEGIGGGGSSAYGIQMFSSGLIASGGPTSTTTVKGTYTDPAGSSNYGVVIQDSTISSGGGDVYVTGIQAGGVNNYAIRTIATGGVSTATNGGNITLIGNTMDLTGGGISAGANYRVTLLPYTDGLSVAIGTTSNPSAGPLSLSNTELNTITAGSIHIGNSTTGPISITAAVAHTTPSNFVLTSGGNIAFTTGSLNTGGGNLSLNPGMMMRSVQPTFTGTDVTTGNATLNFGVGSTLQFTIDGPTVDTQYRQLNIAGQVDLTGVNLFFGGNHTPLPGQAFTIIENDGTDPIIGTFWGYAEGDIVNVNGVNRQITYVGGSGNDVVLLDTVLQVTTITPTPTGFIAQFNHAFEPSTLNLYDEDGVQGPTDVKLIDSTLQEIRGSVLIDPNNRKLTFIKSGGVLPAGNYTVQLMSGAGAFRLPGGGLLDGNSNGTTGDNYSGNMTIDAAAPTAITLGIPDFVRGYGQGVNVPAASAGLPISISNAQGVKSTTFALNYDPTLLSITGASVGAGITGNVTLDTSVLGVAQISVTSTSGLSSTAGLQTLVSLTASVPNNAPYAKKHLLDLTNLQILDTSSATLPAVDNDGIHVAAYFGDSNGSQTYNAPDATLAQRLIVGSITGLGAYQLADPYLVVDISGNAQVQSDDVTQIQRAIVGLSTPEIPAHPGLSTVPGGGPDPIVSIPQNLTASVGQTVTVPVELLVTEPTGITLAGADIAIAYDASTLELTATSVGQLLIGFGLNANTTTPGVIRLSLAGSPLDLDYYATGVLATLQFTVLAGAGTTSRINLLQSSAAQHTALYDAAGRPLTLSPAPSNGDVDEVDGLLEIFGQSSATSSALADAVFAEVGDDDFNV